MINLKSKSFGLWKSLKCNFLTLSNQFNAIFSFIWRVNSVRSVKEEKKPRKLSKHSLECTKSILLLRLASENRTKEEPSLKGFFAVSVRKNQGCHGRQGSQGFWSLAGFWEIENCGSSGGALVKWLPLWRPCLPKIYCGSPENQSKFQNTALWLSPFKSGLIFTQWYGKKDDF